MSNKGDEMLLRLGKSIKVGQKIKTSNGWRKILSVTEIGVTIKEGVLSFGSVVFGWKIK